MAALTDDGVALAILAGKKLCEGGMECPSELWSPPSENYTELHHSLWGKPHLHCASCDDASPRDQMMILREDHCRACCRCFA